MAIAAMKDQQNRKVEVNRTRLLHTLVENRKKHLQEYAESVSGYRDAVSRKLDEAYVHAQKEIKSNYEKLSQQLAEMEESEISSQSDWFTLLDAIDVRMKVPKSYVEDYDAAIAMVKWDVNELLTLTYAEFTCFVRDQWDWQSGFREVSTMYAPRKAF